MLVATPLDATAQSQFAQYAAAIARQLPGFDDIIVGNEPNLNRFWLPQFGLEAARASETRERNFLPFIPWLVRRGHTVRTFPSVNEVEAIGVNTPDDRRRLEAYLRTLERR